MHYTSVFWNYSDKLTSEFCVDVWTDIFVSKCLLQGSCTVSIRWKKILFSLALRTYTTSMKRPSALIPRQLLILKAWNIIDNKYNAVAYL